MENKVLIGTKYNVNDKVFVIAGANIVEKIIKEIRILTTDKYDGITYLFEGTSFSIDERFIFCTKQEAAEAWLASQNLNIGIKDNN